MYDFYRVAAAVPDLKVADVIYNKNKIIEKIDEAFKEGVNLVAFPELAITGYTCGDLFYQKTLLDKCKSAIKDLIAVSSILDMVIIVGSPLYTNHQLYNAAYVLYKGELKGISVKTFLPNYNEFYEKRWFSSALDLDTCEVPLSSVASDVTDDYMVPVGNDLVYSINDDFKFGVEICEDLWAPVTPSSWLAMAGAELIVNPSASNDLINKKEYRKSLILSKSSTLMCDYLYVSAGSGESTTDLVFSGNSLIAEYGKILKENDNVADNNYLLINDIDLGRIRADRVKGKTFKDTYSAYGYVNDVRTVNFKSVDNFGSDAKHYKLNPHPFIPSSRRKRLERCKSIFAMQVGGLIKRLSVTGGKMVVGVSGGMDSTLTLLVCAQALKKLGKPMTDLTGITMPAFGTSGRTYNNSVVLMETLGITVKDIPIKEACLVHYNDIDHDIADKDTTYENVQARERTQVLMDYANKIGAIVVGTGDLSELALGWCTYNGDQMSMYGVNASIPKTLVKWLIESVIKEEIFPDSTEVLKDIIDTPISPELLPPDEDGNISQKTEETVGPYELHDFFLYYMMRYGYSPAKIFFLAKKSFAGTYKPEVILDWMKLFYKRFFSQQFKRSCMPDGVKVGSVALSPRGDWRMPSDASAALWLSEIEGIDVKFDE
ncbi:MAG: NAD(+) synthase [Lachnospiraceae bacterium]|nr:NAD(+) synthase [Lachnospiraceae bacterium]